jgi:hypothetical protein
MMCSNKSTFHMQGVSKEHFGHVIVVGEKVLVELACRYSRFCPDMQTFF